MKPLNIKLSPHDAMLLSSFHREFMDDLKDDPQCESLKKAMANFFEEMCFNMSDESLDDANAEIEVNILLGKSPERPKNLNK